MIVIGYVVVIASLFLLYENVLFFGGIVLFIGGFLARKIYISVRGAEVMLMVLSTAYGYHNGYEPLVLFLIIVGFVMASSNRRYRQERDDWGFEFDLSSFGSSDSNGGGDCSGDGGSGD